MGPGVHVTNKNTGHQPIDAGTTCTTNCQLSEHFNMWLPVGMSRSPVNGKSWWGRDGRGGVIPDIEVPAAHALEVARKQAG